MIREEKDGKLYFDVPRCPKCDKLMTKGFGFKRYVDPTGGGFTFLDITFACHVIYRIPPNELARLNQYKLQDVVLPADVSSMVQRKLS